MTSMAYLCLQSNLPAMGHGNGHPLRVFAQLCVRRRKGKANDRDAKTNIKADDALQSNYFKGSILVLTYLVIVVGFYVSGFSSNMEIMGVDRFDTLALGKQSFKTVGRSRSGRAY